MRGTEKAKARIGRKITRDVRDSVDEAGRQEEGGQRKGPWLLLPQQPTPEKVVEDLRKNNKGNHYSVEDTRRWLIKAVGPQTNYE